ncbi:hypothetical protein [Erythrobacter cryptus]|uniref:hypothetical protein n=1 Tax=Erythrobacter cryptus TaxID=196588 RepID=UPI000415E91B|nr:hypothetical protein [Erythrobacter cryptus]GIX19828.1 MAG: hypothetical protein KatS3mg120_1504 [Erythrobacter sp.]
MIQPGTRRAGPGVIARAGRSRVSTLASTLALAAAALATAPLAAQESATEPAEEGLGE